MRAVLAAEAPRRGTPIAWATSVLDRPWSHLTIVAVARLTTIEHFAPLGGLSHRQLREEALADAADVARQTAQLIGGHLCVEHCATESWRTLIGLVQGEGHDLLIVAEPKRWRDRWLLARAFRHDPERRLMRL